MFDGSVNFNISYGESKNGKKSEELIKKAIEVAQAKEFVEEMDEKYETHIASRWNKCLWWTKAKISNC